MIAWRNVFRSSLPLKSLAIAIVAGIAVDAALHDPEAKAQIDIMKGAFFQPASGVGSLLYECRQGSKAHQAFYGCQYRAQTGQADVFDHYRGAFAARGWSKIGCSSAAECQWRKGAYVATLYWRGMANVANDWDFAVDYTWSG